jgi:hypothetical protein
LAFFEIDTNIIEQDVDTRFNHGFCQVSVIEI